MKKLFFILSAVLLNIALFAAETQTEAFSPAMVDNLVFHVKKQTAENSLQEHLLRAVQQGTMAELDTLKYNEQALAVLPVAQDDKGNNVFHLAKDENVVQVIAFALRNAGANNNVTQTIKRLLEQKNAQGQTPVFKALYEGKANVYAMYSAFIDLPKNLQKAAAVPPAQRAQMLAAIQPHLQDGTSVSLLQAGKAALSQAAAAQPSPETDKLKKEVNILSVYSALFAE